MDFTNSDTALRNREGTVSTVLRLAFGLLKLYIQLTNNIPAVSLGLRLLFLTNIYLTIILKIFEQILFDYFLLATCLFINYVWQIFSPHIY